MITKMQRSTTMKAKIQSIKIQHQTQHGFWGLYPELGASKRLFVIIIKSTNNSGHQPTRHCRMHHHRESRRRWLLSRRRKGCSIIRPPSVGSLERHRAPRWVLRIARIRREQRLRRPSPCRLRRESRILNWKLIWQEGKSLRILRDKVEMKHKNAQWKSPNQWPSSLWRPRAKVQQTRGHHQWAC